MLNNDAFFIDNEEEFLRQSLETFNFQFQHNSVYRNYCELTGCNPSSVDNLLKIPFLPVSFFKSHRIITDNAEPEKVFLSSGTTGAERSRHAVASLQDYRLSLLKGFEYFYGSLKQYEVYALTPSPAENPDSSLIFMLNEWIKQSDSAFSGFYLQDFPLLARRLKEKDNQRKKMLIGLSYALLDFSEQFHICIPEVIIMETGGMKGKREEMVKDELHAILRKNFSTNVIHSEYGMTELLSQAYSAGNGLFRTPRWMKVLLRDPDDPLDWIKEGTGGINIIDLANRYSCSFIATQDLGRLHPDGSFEVLGRFDDSDIRGCNLMIG